MQRLCGGVGALRVERAPGSWLFDAQTLALLQVTALPALPPVRDNMEAAQLQQALAGIASGTEQKQKGEAYRTLLQQVFANPSVDACNAFIEHGGFVVGRCAAPRMQQWHKCTAVPAACSTSRHGAAGAQSPTGPSVCAGAGQTARGAAPPRCAVVSAPMRTHAHASDCDKL